MKNCVKNIIIKNKSENGFSLMGVLISVYIILTALVGIMALISSINASASASSSRLVAANLAQEGIEVVKNIRDLSLDTSNWDNWYDLFSGSSEYLVQYDDTSLWRAWQDIPLKYDTVTGLYGYDAGIVTPFAYKRKITLTSLTQDIDGNTIEIKVSVQITWVEHGRAGSLTVEDRLWNWR
ncbi:hypothetical protein KJ866_03195 [Patescibacteria group bacterium]|nr:hypothetical protein [Patescibacteria group bacterium]MBU2265162.1 hypothetical protein [Patescibacteria group bacterium]